MNEVKELKEEIRKIKERNVRVEADKAWEVSFVRKIVITVLTYIVIVIFFFVAELPKPFLNAIIPSVAFILSTMSLSIFKKIWVGNRNKKS